MQCPWPLNSNTEEEIRIHDDPNSTSSSSTSGKKRKKEKYKEKENCLGDSLSENLEKLDSLVESDKCKSPNSKKLKLTKSDPCEPVLIAKESKKSIDKIVNADDNSCSSESEGKSSSKSKRLGSKEKDILNYINENFHHSPKPVLTVGEVVEEELDSTVDIKENPIVEKDEFQFKAIPVAVRAPIKLPRHASNILSSHLDSEKGEDGEQAKRDEEDEAGDSDLECSLMSDPDESDSELESLVSECSTMTAASEASSLGDMGEGAGKRKRRGKKKKRKDRRKHHAGKCSKEQHRQSDLAMLITEDTEEGEAKTEPATDISPSETADTKKKEENEEESVVIVNKAGICETDNVQREDILVVEKVEPVLSAMSTSSSASGPPVSSMSVSSSKVTPAASSMSLESDSEEKKVTGMSVTPDTKLQEPITASSDTHQPISAQQPPDIVVRSPESDDEEMADLTKFQMKWKSFADPLSPMSPSGSVTSVGEDQDLVDSDAPLTLKTHPTKKRTQEAENKNNIVSAPSSCSKDDSAVFKQPQVTPSPCRPVSLPSASSDSPSSKMTSSKHPSLPNISNKQVSSQETSAAKINKSKGLDSILNNLTKKNEEGPEASKEVPKHKAQPLPDGPYPRRRGRKSAAKKFSLSSDSDASDRDSLSVSSASSTCATPTKQSSEEPPTATPPRRGRGRPPKNKDPPKPIEKPLPSPVAASSPVVTRKLTPVSVVPPSANGKVMKLVPCAPPSSLVPCAPPPGLRLVPCKPPRHLANKKKAPVTPGSSQVPTVMNGTSSSSKAGPSSLFDIDESDDLVGKVQKALEKQNENNGPRVENPPTSDDAEVAEDPPLTKLSKPSKTFARVPKKQPAKDIKELKLVRDINFETVLVPQETSIELPTLSMVSFDSDDPDYALVKKLGAGVKKDASASGLQSLRPGSVSSSEVSAGPSRGDNSVVFHVATQAMISQPTASDNLEVRILRRLFYICYMYYRITGEGAGADQGAADC